MMAQRKVVLSKICERSVRKSGKRDRPAPAASGHFLLEEVAFAFAEAYRGAPRKILVILL